MSVLPPMTFDPASLVDDERLDRGPLVVFWGQDKEEEAAPSMRWPACPRPRLRDRLRRRVPWRVSLRLAPPPGTDLEEFGRTVAASLSVDWQGPPQDGHRAVWLPGYVFARHAPAALGSAALVLKRLRGIEVGAAQVRVEAEPESESSP